MQKTSISTQGLVDTVQFAALMKTRLARLIACALLMCGISVWASDSAASQGAQSRVQPLPPMKEMIPVRSGIDRGFRFRASNFYPPMGFFEPSEEHMTLMRYKLQQCGKPECAEAARTLTRQDFGFIPIDLNGEIGPGAHGFMVPRAGGKACTPRGCFWLVLSGNINNWAAIQSEVGFGNYLAVMGEYGNWAELREDEQPDGAAQYFIPLRRWQGTYQRAESRADLARLKAHSALDNERFEADLMRQNTGSTGNMGGWQPSGPPAGQGATVRDHWGKVFPMTEYLPITNFSDQGDYGKFPELLERRTAEQLSRNKQAVLDEATKARDGTSPTLRLTSEKTQVLSLEGFDRGPDVYQLRIFYRAKPGVAVVGDIIPKFADGGEWTIGTLITPAYEPQDSYNWGVGYVSVTRYPDGAFGASGGEGSEDGSLKSLTVELGPKDDKGEVFIEKIELWKLGFAEGDPQLMPEMP